MTDTERSVVLVIDVSTDQELTRIHGDLSRIALGYVLDDLDARVHVMFEDDDGDEVALVGPDLVWRDET